MNRIQEQISKLISEADNSDLWNIECALDDLKNEIKYKRYKREFDFILDEFMELAVGDMDIEPDEYKQIKKFVERCVRYDDLVILKGTYTDGCPGVTIRYLYREMELAYMLDDNIEHDINSPKDIMTYIEDESEYILIELCKKALSHYQQSLNYEYIEKGFRF